MEDHRKQHKKPNEYRHSKRGKYDRTNNLKKRERAQKLSHYVNNCNHTTSNSPINSDEVVLYPFTCKIASYHVNNELYMCPENHVVENGTFLNITANITFLSDEHYMNVMSQMACPF